MLMQIVLTPLGPMYVIVKIIIPVMGRTAKVIYAYIILYTSLIGDFLYEGWSFLVLNSGSLPLCGSGRHLPG